MTTRPPDRAGLDAEEEARFLARYDASKFERLSLAVDVVLISAFDGHLFTLLARRKEHPHKNRWALPGGFVRPKESLEDAAARLLETKGGLTGVFLEQLYTFGAPNRDPRTRVVSIAYYALVEQKRFVGISDRDPDVSTPKLRVPWDGETGGPVQALDASGRPLPMAFDHAEMLGLVVKRLRGKLDYAPIGFELLGETFTLLELQRVHEAVLGHRVNKDSFRRRPVEHGPAQSNGP